MSKKDYKKSITYNKIQDMIGKTYGYLTVLGFSKVIEKPIYDKRIGKSTLNKFYYLNCKCICEKIIDVTFYAINKTTFSCGCINGSDKRKKYDPIEANAREAYRFYSINKPGNLSFDQFKKISALPCYYCNAPPSNITRGSSKAGLRYNNPFIYSGLDRLDNSRPHDYDNCVPACFNCNYAKSDMTEKDFIEWIKRVYLFQNKGKYEI